jgi:hypothetical protein
VYQEDALVWIGQMNMTGAGGTFDAATSELLGGLVYNLPRNDDCDIVYCNIEVSTTVVLLSVAVVCYL